MKRYIDREIALSLDFSISTLITINTSNNTNDKKDVSYSTNDVIIINHINYR